MTDPLHNCFAGMDTTQTTRLRSTQCSPGPGNGVLTPAATTLARLRAFGATGQRLPTDGAIFGRAEYCGVGPGQF